jgi:hypothetical protein
MKRLEKARYLYWTVTKRRVQWSENAGHTLNATLSGLKLLISVILWNQRQWFKSGGRGTAQHRMPVGCCRAEDPPSKQSTSCLFRDPLAWCSNYKIPKLPRSIIPSRSFHSESAHTKGSIWEHALAFTKPPLRELLLWLIQSFQWSSTPGSLCSRSSCCAVSSSFLSSPRRPCQVSFTMRSAGLPFLCLGCRWSVGALLQGACGWGAGTILPLWSLHPRY